MEVLPLYTAVVPIPMLGSIINALAVIAGSLIGVGVGRKVPKGMSDAVFKALGVVTGIIGISGVISAIFTVNPLSGRLESEGVFLLLISLVVGCVIGESLKIDERLSALGRKVEARLGASGFARGFVTASLLFPVGAMSVMGALYDGLTGDISILLLKSSLDFTASIILASTLGIGVLFSFIPLFIFQGSITLLAGAIYPFVTQSLLDMFSMVGYAVVMCIGINFVADTNIKVANLLPGLVLPVVYYFIIG